jgi:MFS family permease
LAGLLPSLLPSVRGFPVTFWWLVAGILVNRLGSFVVPFLAVYLSEARGVPLSTAGAVVSLLGAGAVAASVVGGLLADRWGRRATMLLSCGVAGAAMVALGFASSLPLVGALVLAVGLFGDLFRPAMHAAVADVVPPGRRLAAFGLVYWAVNLGWALSQPTAGLLSAWSWTALFVGDGATTLLFGLVVLARVPETRPAVAREAGGRPLAGLARALGDPVFRRFFALQFLLVLAFWQVVLAQPADLMLNEGMSKPVYGLVAALNAVFCVLLQPTAARLAEGRDPARVMALAGLLVGAGFGLYLLTDSPWGYAACIAVWTAGEVANAAVAPAVVAALAPPAHRGAYQGAWTMTWGLGALLGPPLGGLALERGGPAAVWLGCLAAGLAACAGQLRAGRGLRARLGPGGLSAEAAA